MDDMQNYRKEIDRIDSALLALFEERMEVSDAIGRYKASRGMPVFDSAREEEKIADVRGRVTDAGKADDVETLFRKIMEVSRERQERLQ